MIWIPDTTLYNTYSRVSNGTSHNYRLLMKDDEMRRPQHVKLTTDFQNKRVLVEFLYPAIYKFYCRLYLQVNDPSKKIFKNLSFFPSTLRNVT